MVVVKVQGCEGSETLSKERLCNVYYSKTVSTPSKIMICSLVHQLIQRTVFFLSPSRNLTLSKIYDIAHHRTENRKDKEVESGKRARFEAKGRRKEREKKGKRDMEKRWDLKRGTTKHI
jgi:hypothetical protein